MNRDSDPFWFTPQHQRNAEVPVEFYLRPLDDGEKATLSASILKNGNPVVADFERLLLENVADWRGVGGPCTLERRRGLLDSEPAGDWNNWMLEVLARLYVKERPTKAAGVPDGCGCCPQCLAGLPDHWLYDTWRYCPHNRAMSVRRAADRTWTITKGVKPKKAAAHLAAARKRMQAFAKANGLDLSTLDKQFADIRRRDRGDL